MKTIPQFSDRPPEEDRYGTIRDLTKRAELAEARVEELELMGNDLCDDFAAIRQQDGMFSTEAVWRAAVKT